MPGEDEHLEMAYEDSNGGEVDSSDERDEDEDEDECENEYEDEE